MNLLPPEYDWNGIDTHCAYHLQARVQERIEAIEGKGNNDKPTRAVLEELETLNLSLSVYISKTVKNQEEQAAKDRKRREEHDARVKENEGKPIDKDNP